MIYCILKMLSELTAFLSVPAQSTASLSSLLTSNIHKDLPLTSLRLAAKGFWGGSSTTFGGITPMHTVTIPNLIASTAIKSTLQENINPSLNMNNSANSIGLVTLGGPGKPAPFNSFTDSNPFTIKVLDAYMSFYPFSLLGLSDCHVVAQVLYAAVDSPCTATTTTATHFYLAALPIVCFTIAPAAHRPCGWPLPTLFHYYCILAQFLCDTNPLLPQRQASCYPIFLCTCIPHTTLHTQAQLYVRFCVVIIISDSTTGGAFWQAFSGFSSRSSPSPFSALGAGPSTTQCVPAWDANKVQHVLEGMAIVRIVDVELLCIGSNEEDEDKDNHGGDGPLGTFLTASLILFHVLIFFLSFFPSVS